MAPEIFRPAADSSDERAKYCEQGTINGKVLRKDVFHPPTVGLHIPTVGCSPH